MTDINQYWQDVRREADRLLDAGYVFEPPAPRAVACEYCNDQGWIEPVDEQGQYYSKGHRLHAVFLPCRNPECSKGEAARAQYRASRLAKSELDARYQNMTFESWWRTVQNKRGKYTAFFAVQDFAKAWRNNHQIELRSSWERMCKTLNSNQSYTGDDVTRNWMVLFGSVGTTKTGLTAAFMNYVLAEGGDVVWHKFDTLLRRARKAIDDGGSMDSILQAYATAPVLVLDEFKGANMLVNHDGRIESTYDVGITELSRFERASAELIINTRYNAGLPTLFTTNSDFAGMEAYWGQLIAGRLMTAHWIPVQGGNERPVPPNIGAV